MSKASDVTFEQALALIERVSQELGLIVAETGGFKKITGPTNKHRIYVQKSRTLNRIDFTVELPTDDPMYRQPNGPNGAIKCHIVPTLENLERGLRMLGDASLTVQVSNKPRPFAPTRKPKPVVAPVPAAALEELKLPPGTVELAERLAIIKQRAREARISMILENPDRFGEMSYEEAESLVDSRVSLAEFEAKRSGVSHVELNEVLAETGIEVAS